MIISDEYRFAFIHIPKCAGTSIRGALEPFDSREGSFTGRVGHHANLGELDYVHIPLFTLRDHFEREFEAVQRYWSFAVVRDPLSRFASSVSQNLRMYSDKRIQNRSVNEVKSSIHNAIDYLTQLEQDSCLLPPKFIHFQKQIDYIQIDGVRIIDSLYAVTQTEELMADVTRKIGKNLSMNLSKNNSKIANRTVVYRNDLLRTVIDTSRPVLDRFRKILPENVKQEIRDRVYVPRDKRLKILFEDSRVQDFIKKYYADDIALYRSLIDTPRVENA
jgi:hypothetical protein